MYKFTSPNCKITKISPQVYWNLYSWRLKSRTWRIIWCKIGHYRRIYVSTWKNPLFSFALFLILGLCSIHYTFVTYLSGRRYMLYLAFSNSTRRPRACSLNVPLLSIEWHEELDTEEGKWDQDNGRNVYLEILDKFQ